MNNQESEDLTNIDSQSNQSDDGIVFDAEAENLSAQNWFKPDEGTTQVKFLDNGRKEKRTYDDEERDVGVFTVEVDGEELQWSVTVGNSKVSLWGQLMRLGAARDGLKGEKITLIRSGTKQDTTYTVQEAADL